MALTSKRVEKLLRRGEVGRFFDGNGLYLVITGRGTGNWSRRYELDGKGHWAGLGSYAAFSLAEARLRNRKVSQQLADGIDPLAEKRARKAAMAAASAVKLTFREATERFVAQSDAGWTPKHAAEYLGTLQRFAWPHLGALDVAEIGTAHVLAVLEQQVPEGSGSPGGQFWTARAVTADRLRNRIESVLNWATARGHRPAGPNPASWDHLRHILPKPSKIARVEHHKAAPYRELPALFESFKTHQGVAIEALRLLILTAARAGEVIGATWSEIDLDSAVWVIPAERMKARKEHRQPLAPQVLTLLRGLPRENGNPFVFVGQRSGAGLGVTALSQTLKRLGCDATVHGMRSAFSDWAHEQTAHSNHTIELCLAHAIGTEVEKAYQRSDLIAKRAQLLKAWATYCCSPAKAGTVVPLRQGAPA
jgi:integrase